MKIGDRVRVARVFDANDIAEDDYDPTRYVGRVGTVVAEEPNVGAFAQMVSVRFDRPVEVHPLARNRPYRGDRRRRRLKVDGFFPEELELVP